MRSLTVLLVVAASPARADPPARPLPGEREAASSYADAMDFEHRSRWQVELALLLGGAPIDGVPASISPGYTLAAGFHRDRLAVLGEYTLAELRFRAPFICNPHVVEPLIRINQLLKAPFRFAVAVRRNACELIGKRESKQPQCKLMLWFDRQNIATDRLCFFRFVEAAVELRLCNGLGDTCGGDAFQLVCHGAFL